MEHLHPFQFLHHGIVVVNRFAKAEARVEDDILLPHRAQLIDSLGTVEQHLAYRRLTRHIYIRYAQTAHHTEHVELTIDH